MQMRVNNELRPWPPHYSPPWNSQKSDIVSLRFLSQSSGTLFIVGWTESELRIDIRGPQTSCAYDHRTSCGAGSQRALNASFQIWVRSHKRGPFIYLPFIVYYLKCMPVLLWGGVARQLDLSFEVLSLFNGGNSPAAPLQNKRPYINFFWHLVHALGEPCRVCFPALSFLLFEERNLAALELYFHGVAVHKLQRQLFV